MVMVSIMYLDGKKDGDLRAKGMAKSPGYVRLALMDGIGDMKLPFYSYSACMMFVSGEDYYTPKRSSFLYYKRHNIFSASHRPLCDLYIPQVMSNQHVITSQKHHTQRQHIRVSLLPLSGKGCLQLHWCRYTPVQH